MPKEKKNKGIEQIKFERCNAAHPLSYFKQKNLSYFIANNNNSSLSITFFFLFLARKPMAVLLILYILVFF